jgi:hypothetical protein
MDRDNDKIRRHLELIVGDDRMSAETALQYLLDEFNFDVEELLKASSMGMNYPHLAVWDSSVQHIFCQKSTETSASLILSTETLLQTLA